MGRVGRRRCALGSITVALLLLIPALSTVAVADHPMSPDDISESDKAEFNRHHPPDVDALRLKGQAAGADPESLERRPNLPRDGAEEPARGGSPRDPNAELRRVPGDGRFHRVHGFGEVRRNPDGSFTSRGRLSGGNTHGYDTAGSLGASYKLPAVWNDNARGACWNGDPNYGFTRVVYARMDPAHAPYPYNSPKGFDGYPSWAPYLDQYTHQAGQAIWNNGIAASNWGDVPRLILYCASPMKVTVPGLGTDQFSKAHDKQQIGDAVIAEAARLGQQHPTGKTKFLVFYDGPCYEGYAGHSDIVPDSQPYYYNGNMGGGYRGNGMVSVVYHCVEARDNDYWNPGEWDKFTVLHELWHSMGAVQPGAPAYFDAASTCENCPYHVNDGVDVMSARDPGYTETHCPNPSEPALDCGYDSFFDTRTEPGSESYLYPRGQQQRWNTGSKQNVFLHFYVGGET